MKARQARLEARAKRLSGAPEPSSETVFPPESDREVDREVRTATDAHENSPQDETGLRACGQQLLWSSPSVGSGALGSDVAKEDHKDMQVRSPLCTQAPYSPSRRLLWCFFAGFRVDQRSQ